MKIIFLPSSYMPETLGGTETYVHELAQHLAKHGVEVVVTYHSAVKEKLKGDLKYRIEILEDWGEPERSELYRNSLYEDPPGFRELLRREKPDLVHFHSYTLGAGHGHARVTRDLGIRYLVTYHTPAMSCPRGTLFLFGRELCDGQIRVQRCSACLLQSQKYPLPLAELLSRSPLDSKKMADGRWIVPLAMPSLLGRWQAHWLEFMKNAEHIVACAEWCQSVLEINGISPEKISVVRQVVGEVKRHRQLKLPPAIREKLRLGFLGRFTRVKAPELVLEVTQKLRERGIKVQCELVGPIVEADKKWAKKTLARHAQNGSYLGIKKGEELRSWVANLDLLMVPGQWMETGPLTLLEAWDQGVPVVGVNMGGVKEFMHAAGMESLLFEPNNLPSAVEAVLRALAWDSSRPPDVLIQGQDYLCEKMLEIYRSAVSGAASLAS